MAFVLNGKLHEDDRLHLSWQDPFFQTGLGVFETLRTIDGHPMFLGAHLERLGRGARYVGLGDAPDQESVAGDIKALLDHLGSGHARVRISLLQGRDASDLLVTAEPAPPFEPCTAPRSLAVLQSPFAPGSTLPGTKLCNRIPYALARMEAERRGFDDALFSAADGTVLETSRANVFFVEDTRLLTPRLEAGILPGVTRAVLLKLARRAGLEVEEGVFLLSRLEQAREVFLTGSFSGIQPVNRMENVTWTPAPGPVTKKLIGLYDALARQGIC